MSAKLRFDDARHAQPLFAGACVGLWAKVVLRCEPSPERRGRSGSFGDRVRVPAGALARGEKLWGSVLRVLQKKRVMVGAGATKQPKPKRKP